MENREIVKLSDCEYEEFDHTSELCHNPPTHVDRESGAALCVNHVEPFRVFMEAREKEADTLLYSIFLEEVKHNDSDKDTIAGVVPGSDPTHIPLGPADENRGD